LKNAPAIFYRVVVAAFKEYIHKFLDIYFDDWTVFGFLKDHVGSLRLMLDRCRQYQISLNLKKCIFGVPFGLLLGNIVCVSTPYFLTLKKFKSFMGWEAIVPREAIK